MALPVDSSLRAALRSGLTSPDPVRTRTPQGTPTPTPKPRTSRLRLRGARRDAHTLIHLRKRIDETRAHPQISRWIQAEWCRPTSASSRRGAVKSTGGVVNILEAYIPGSHYNCGVITKCSVRPWAPPKYLGSAGITPLMPEITSFRQVNIRDQVSCLF
jgi:hypothetical protein